MKYRIHYMYKEERDSNVQGVHTIAVSCINIKAAEIVAEIEKPDDMFIAGIVTTGTASSIKNDT